MKVSELFEAYTPPVKNPKIGYSKDAKIPVGGAKEWLKSMGATPTDVQHALRIVRQSPQYRALEAIGGEDQSTERHENRGSLMFMFSFDEVAGARVRPKKYKVTIQPYGQVQEQGSGMSGSRNPAASRAPISTGKPRIVPGDPVQSIVKTMGASLEKVAATFKRRMDKAAKEVSKFKKSKMNEGVRLSSVKDFTDHVNKAHSAYAEEDGHNVDKHAEAALKVYASLSARDQLGLDADVKDMKNFLKDKGRANF